MVIARLVTDVVAVQRLCSSVGLPREEEKQVVLFSKSISGNSSLSRVDEPASQEQCIGRGNASNMRSNHDPSLGLAVFSKLLVGPAIRFSAQLQA